MDSGFRRNDIEMRVFAYLVQLPRLMVRFRRSLRLGSYVVAVDSGFRRNDVEMRVFAYLVQLPRLMVRFRRSLRLGSYVVARGFRLSPE